MFPPLQARRREMERALFMNQIGAEARDPSMLLFVDHAAKDKDTSNHQSERASSQVKKYFIRGVHCTVISALSLDGIIAYDIVEGAVGGQRFLSFLKEYVMHFTTPLDHFRSP